jgi:hypothetical protein
MKQNHAQKTSLYRLRQDSRPTTVIHFTLEGVDLQPDEITQALGIEPTSAWTRGDARSGSHGKARGQRTGGLWSLAAPCSPYDTLDIQLDTLLDQLETLPPALYDLVQQFAASITIGYRTPTDMVGIHIDPSTLERLHRLRVALDFDIYATHTEEGIE